MTNVQFDAIIADLISGEAIRKALKAHGVSPSVFYPALDRDAARAEQYTRALNAGYHALADATVELADDPSIEPNDKRIRVDIRKWLLGKRAPKVYGEKMLLGGDPENPIPPLVIIGGAKPPDDQG